MKLLTPDSSRSGRRADRPRARASRASTRSSSVIIWKRWIGTRLRPGRCSPWRGRR